jgi:hypothetical protein
MKEEEEEEEKENVCRLLGGKAISKETIRKIKA